jgi:hypothetical protein
VTAKPWRRLNLERLEDRTVLAVALSLNGAQTLVPGANINVSDQVSVLSVESEMSVDINPANPLNVAGFSHDLPTTAWTRA